MTQVPDNAKQTIRLHAGHVAIEGRRSLVGELRPYSGILESDFRDLFTSLVSLHGSLGSDELDRELIYACWDLCTRVRFLTPTLAANQLVDEQQQQRLSAWVNCVDSYCRRCFHQLGLVECMSNFFEYLGSDLCSSPETYRNLLPILNDLRSDADFEMLSLLDAAISAVDP
jgi:hypothetical protein